MSRNMLASGFAGAISAVVMMFALTTIQGLPDRQALPIAPEAPDPDPNPNARSAVNFVPPQDGEKSIRLMYPLLFDGITACSIAVLIAPCVYFGFQALSRLRRRRHRHRYRLIWQSRSVR